MARTCDNDPLEKFRFLVDFTLPGAKTPTRTGFHDVQMPKRATNKINYREGGDPDINAISAGLSTMEDVVMSRGVVAAEGAVANDFLSWCKTIHTPTPGISGYNTNVKSNGSKEYRSEVTIKMLDRTGTVVRAWKLNQAWPVNFVPASDLSAAEDGDKSMESLTLTYEDFQELTVTTGTVGTDVL